MSKLVKNPYARNSNFNSDLEAVKSDYLNIKYIKDSSGEVQLTVVEKIVIS